LETVKKEQDTDEVSTVSTAQDLQQSPNQAQVSAADFNASSNNSQSVDRDHYETDNNLRAQ
jgi:hypothetical protein